MDLDVLIAKENSEKVMQLNGQPLTACHRLGLGAQPQDIQKTACEHRRQPQPPATSHPHEMQY